MVLRRDDAGSPVAEYREYLMTPPVWLSGIPSSSPGCPVAGVNDDRHRFRANSQEFFDEPERRCCRDASDGSAKGRPFLIRFEKSGESLAARARVSIRLRVFSSAKGSPPVTMTWRSYISSSPFPLSRIRQSHGTRSLRGCCVRMLVVQLVVIALYQRGVFRRALSEWMY